MALASRCAAFAASMLLLLQQAPAPIGACSMPDPFHPVSGRNMYAAADLVATGDYVSEQVVERRTRTNHSNDVLYMVVNSTFAVKDALASNSSAPGHCFPATIVIHVTVVDGCIDRRSLWQQGTGYAVVLRALNAAAGYYELFEGSYQAPFTDLTDDLAHQLRSIACNDNSTCIASHPSLCHAARLAPVPPGSGEVEPPTDVPPPTDVLPSLPTNDFEDGAAAEQDGRGTSGDDASMASVAGPTTAADPTTTTSAARTTAALSSADALAAVTPLTAAVRSGSAQARSTCAPVAATLAAVAAAVRWPGR